MKLKTFMKETLQEVIPKFTFFEILTNNPKLMFASIPVIAATPAINIWDTIFVLNLLMIFDLITGLLGSWWVWRKKENREDLWFFGRGEGFNSSMFKTGFAKIIVYYGVPTILENFRVAYHLKDFKIEFITNDPVSLPTFFILLFCMNEGFSIFQENLPKMGFNLWERVKKIIGFSKEVTTELIK